MPVAKYLEQNGTGFLGFAVPDQAAFFGAKSLFAAKDLATNCEQEPCKARRHLESLKSMYVVDHHAPAHVAHYRKACAGRPSCMTLAMPPPDDDRHYSQ